MTDPNPVPARRRPALARAAARLLGRFARAPRAIRYGAVLVLAAGLAAGGHYGRAYSLAREREREVAAAWRSFDDAADRADVAAMDAALVRVLALVPGDGHAAALRSALATGSAGPGDARVGAALVSAHLREGRLPDAAREARRVIESDPAHWRSLCVLAHHAMVVDRDDGAARRWLLRLPDPGHPDTRLDAGGLLHAARLAEPLGLDAGPFRRALVARVLPSLRVVDADAAAQPARVQLIDCYLEAFAGDASLVELSGYWGAVSRLADAAVSRAEGEGDVAVLVRVGEFGPPLRDALARIRDDGLVPPDRFAPFAKEVDDRTRRAWLTVRARQPARAEAYAGLAVLSVREGHYRRAVETLLEGLSACGDRPELLDKLARVATATGNGHAAVAVTRAAAEKDPSDPRKWCLAAAAAHADGRHAEAIAACRKARARAGDHPWASRIEVSARLAAGDHAGALDLLRSLGEAAVRSDPGLARLAVRALAETGEVTTAEAVADQVERAELARGSAPRLSTAAVRGLLDAGGDADFVARTAARSLRLTSHWPDDALAHHIQADAHYRLAELASPPWPPDVARTALRAYARLPRDERTSPEVVAAVAALELKALHDPAAAWRTLAPFRDPAAVPLLRPHHRELLAACRDAESGGPGSRPAPGAAGRGGR